MCNYYWPCLVPRKVSVHSPICQNHSYTRLSLCNCMPHFFFSVMLNTVFFLLRSKVNKKAHGLTTANMDSGFSFGVGRNLDSCSICTDQVRNWGSKCHFSTFYFIVFLFVLFVFFCPFTFPMVEVLFYCTFWYLLNLMYCMVVFLHVYWING